MNGALVSGLMFPAMPSHATAITQGRKPGRDSAISRLQTQSANPKSDWDLLHLVALNRFTVLFSMAMFDHFGFCGLLGHLAEEADLVTEGADHVHLWRS